MSKQTQGQSEDRCGGSGVLHPVREKQGENRGRQRKNIGWLKKPLEKKRKNGRKTRRVNRSMRRAARLKTRVGQLTVGTFDVRTPALNGNNGLGHVEEILNVCKQ